ncbi:hypothetical protein OO006_00530 [Prosthecochloris sp. SCSIO W1101]|nr:hypothetical protein [Prosthecochloris sp. SCSIO W1101]UZJ42813.1 hypothetical protein OO006_00530 [Prosthecochloris sp. SCSIO W1101]
MEYKITGCMSFERFLCLKSSGRVPDG